MSSMAVTAKKLDVNIGDVVEIEGRKYDVVSDKHGGVALEPAITDGYRASCRAWNAPVDA